MFVVSHELCFNFDLSSVNERTVIYKGTFVSIVNVHIHIYLSPTALKYFKKKDSDFLQLNVLHIQNRSF